MDTNKWALLYFQPVVGFISHHEISHKRKRPQQKSLQIFI
jgi:hypothetical protein